MRYSNVLQAITGASRLILRSGDKPLVVYSCPKCDGIHIGHAGIGEHIVEYGEFGTNMSERIAVADRRLKQTRGAQWEHGWFLRQKGNL